MLQSNPMYSYIPAQDVSRARHFYEEEVGFKPGWPVEDGPEQAEPDSTPGSCRTLVL